METKTLKTQAFSKTLLIFFLVVFAAIGGYFIWHSFAAGPPIISGTVNLTANVTDDVGVSWVHFKLDNDVLFLGIAENNPQAQNGPFTMTWDTTKFPNGTHTVTADAYDTGNHVVSSNTVSVDIENAGSTVTQSGLLAKNIYQTDAQWTCSGTVNLDSVSVLMLHNSVPAAVNDAVHISGCGGTIGRINVVTYTQDGMKLGGTNLTINSGIIRCYGRYPLSPNGGVHQDGVQSLGGTNNLVKNLDDRCYTAINANWYMTWNTNNNGSIGPPAIYTGGTNNICDGCTFGSGTSSNMFVNDNTIGSGARNSVVCPANNLGLSVRIGGNKAGEPPPLNPIPLSNSPTDLAAANDVMLTASDPRCAKPPGLGSAADVSPPTISLLTPSSGSSGGGSSVPGDTNGDGHVTIADLTFFLNNWKTSNSICDFNSDGKVDLLDMSILLAHYGT